MTAVIEEVLVIRSLLQVQDVTPQRRNRPGDLAAVHAEGSGVRSGGRARCLNAAPTPRQQWLKFVLKVTPAALAALQLTAGGFGEAAGGNQQNRIRRQVKLLGQRRADAFDQLVQRVTFRPQHFLHDHQPLTGLVVALLRRIGKRHAAIHLQRLMRGLHARLEFMGKVVAASNDDQILQPAGDEELFSVDEP